MGIGSPTVYTFVQRQYHGDDDWGWLYACPCHFSGGGGGFGAGEDTLDEVSRVICCFPVFAGAAHFVRG